MRAETVLEFNRRPSALAYMLGAVHRSPGLRDEVGFPPIRARWHGMRIDPRELTSFLRLTGLNADKGLPMLYPQVVCFPLQMAVLTCRAFPLPIWNALQVRNSLLQHSPISAEDVLDVETDVVAQRIIQKGVEVDLRTTVRSNQRTLWEGVTSFYYRGRSGTGGPPSPRATAPTAADRIATRWRSQSGVGLEFARLSGDYNGIHLSSMYARRFGFRRAFHHPPLVLGQCMARIPSPDADRPQRFDAWLKGPVFYGDELTLHGAPAPHDTTFALTSGDDNRPAMIGRWQSCESDCRLIDSAN